MIRAVVFACLLCPTILLAQLPSNYKTIFENDDVLVQRVHYAPHETVPMHDHPAVTTIYLYLNNDKGFTILHEGHDTPVNRPAAHAGAIRVTPGNLERHSIVNSSDVPSDFLRIELKEISVHTLHGEYRGPAPTQPYPVAPQLLYNNPVVQVERTVCANVGKCETGKSTSPALILVATLGAFSAEPLVQWQPATGSSDPFTLIRKTDKPVEILRIILPKQ